MLVGPFTKVNLGPENNDSNSASPDGRITSQSQGGATQTKRIWSCGLRDVDGGSLDSEQSNPTKSNIIVRSGEIGGSSSPDNRSRDSADSIRSRAKAVQILNRRRQIARYKAHPWPFLCEQVLTEDPHDKAGLIKPYPQLAYLEDFVNDWVRERRILVPKSRRMLASWTCIALHVWLLLFHDREYIYFAARKEGRDESEGSLELVKRAKFIINNLRDFSPPPTEQKRGRIICLTTHSEIVAVAQGEHQMRQLSATAIFADEFAFWEHARQTYTAARPTIEGTGRFTGVSSAHPGFFKDLVFDEVA
jgi:hypothetical protein